jgi:hypothetical protein
MTATLTQVVKQFQQDWTSQLEPDAILMACRSVAYRWRERTLDPVTTIQLFFVQILHGNTACTHLRHLTNNWLRVSDTAERSQVDQRIGHQLHAIMPLLDAFKSGQ